MKVPRVLIIAGSDSGGGAGIQADIKTVTMLGGHAMTAITAITAQNTLGVDAVMPVPTKMVLAQIDAVVRDIGVDVVKIGMIGSAETAEAVADWLELYRDRQKQAGELPWLPVIFDPVMVATSGAVLAEEATVAAFRRLMDVAFVITPNVPELAALTGMPVGNEAEVSAAGADLARRHDTYVLAKGGHLGGDQVIDRLFDMDGRQRHTAGPRIDTQHTHGTGCTLASAIAVLVGRDRDIGLAVDEAQSFVRAAMLAAPGFGGGHGPMGHWAANEARMNLNQVTLPARDYAEAVDFYRRLGLTQIVDSPGNGYARFECPGGSTVSIHVEAAPRAGDALVYLESVELDEWVNELSGSGIGVAQQPRHESWGWREARLTDPTGNKLCLYHAGANRRFPPWRISTAE